MHIEYDCQGLEGQFTTQMWQFLNNALFDPVLPFVLEGDRTPNELRARSRVILGNHVRLSHVDRAKGDLAVAAHDAHKINAPGSTAVSLPNGGYSKDHWDLLQGATP